MKPSRHLPFPRPASVARLLVRGLSRRPRLGLELGSGFGAVAAAITVEREWRFTDIPGFPAVGVRGHDGRLLLGAWHGVPVAILSGRAHYYEGVELAATTFPVRVLAAMGVTTMLFTNAAGGIRKGFQAGDFMAFADHLNFLGANPLRGPEWPGRQRFVDLTTVYDPAMRKLLMAAAQHVRVRLHEGVYLAVSGPSYETPAEIRAFRRWGADAVGMSTVPGAIVARQCGLQVAAVSCLTNLAAGLAPNGTGINHEIDVLGPSPARAEAAIALIGEFIRRWSKRPPPNSSAADATAATGLRR